MKTLYTFFIISSLAFISSKAQQDLSEPPKAGPAPEIKLGEFEQFELENGLKVFVVENHKIPQVTYSINFDIDPIYEGEQAGYISLAGDLIGTMTTTRTKDEIDEQVDYIGGTLSAGSGSVYASSLTKHQDVLLDLMSDVVMNAEFSKDQLEKYRMQNLSGLQAMQKDPKSISGYLSKSILYGKDTPFGELVTENTLKNVSIDLCRDYYKTYYRPNIAYMAVVGDITPEEAMEKIQKYFGLWQSADIPGKQIDIPEAPEKRKVIVYDRPESVQSVIRVTYPVEFKLKSDDYFQARVMNTILGGGVYRLFENLREKHGWTYGSYSSLSQSKYIGNFTAFADVSNAVTDSAVNEILYEMNRLRDEQVPANELNRVKNYMTGNFALSLENPSTIARFAINIERYDLPDDYYRNYLKSIDQVTAGQVMSAANKYLRPEESYVFVVGNKKEIDEKLKELSSENKVHTINITGDIKE